MEIKILDKKFFERDTPTVAKDLIGKYLYRQTDEGIYRAMISETEAYHGTDDRACHCSKGKTPRTEIMFDEAGKIYVYLIYGMYYMLNFVTMPYGFPAAVLIRAIDDLEIKKTGKTEWEKLNLKTNGPGKLTKHLKIDKRLNQLELTPENRLWVADSQIIIPEKNILTTPRIGIDYAKESKDLPWRFKLDKKS